MPGKDSERFGQMVDVGNEEERMIAFVLFTSSEISFARKSNVGSSQL